MSTDKKHTTSFVVRSRNSSAKHKFISTNGKDIVVNYQEQPTDWHELFGGLPSESQVQDTAGLTADGKLIVEIGFGGGEVLVEMAKQRPEDLFIGIEVYPTGVARVIKQIKDDDLHNISLVQHDAAEALRDMFEDKILDEIRVLFPDPWPKKRHNKRRLLKREFLQLMADKLKVGGIMHLATDWQEYAEEIMQDLKGMESDGILKNLCNDGGAGYADGRQMSRPATKFELKALEEGRQVYEFLFEKQS